MALDPVCKMEVKESGSPSAEYNGKTYYFCADACKATFAKDPGKYVSGEAAGGHGHGHGHGGHSGGCH